MTINLNSVIGLVVTLALIALIGSIGVLIHAEKLLERCKAVLNFAMFIASRDDEYRTLRRLEQEDYHCEGTD